jgi:hypothetical protein
MRNARTTAQQGDNGSDDLDDDVSDEGGAYGDNTEEEDRYFNHLNYTFQSLAVHIDSLEVHISLLVYCCSSYCCCGYCLLQQLHCV